MGKRTLHGAEATLHREALAEITDMVEVEIACAANIWEFGVAQFDQLKPEAKLALRYGGIPTLNAINGATVAVLFRHIEQSIQIEIDTANDLRDPFFWRRHFL